MTRSANFSIALNLVLLAAVAGCQKSDAPQAAMPAEGSAAAASTEAAPVDPVHPTVLLETSLGKIKVQLDGERSKATVENFVRYVQSGFYDQTIIHQVYPGQGFLGGGYGPDFLEKQAAGAPIKNEAKNGLRNVRGTISMVRIPDVIDSATSQFFINVADNPELDHHDDSPEGYGYCVFGTVVHGMDIVDKIAAVPVGNNNYFDNTPNQAIVIQSAKFVP